MKHSKRLGSVVLALTLACSGSSDDGGAASGGSSGGNTGGSASGQGGDTNAAGDRGNAGNQGNAGDSGNAGNQGMGGNAGNQGNAGDSGNAGNNGNAGDNGSAGNSGGNAGGAGGQQPVDERPWFTFFVTSEAGIRFLSEDKENGMGGDLGGLAGADEKCAILAQRSNPGDNKTWRAFLSTARGGEDDGPIHAIDRIGEGPWHDYNNRLLANNTDELINTNRGRPSGAHPQIAEMFTDENGDVASPDTNVIDNHDTLTGSDTDGRLNGGYRETCNDWTSDSENLGRPWIGHSWPRNQNSGREWLSEHRAGGCGKGIDTTKQASNGTPTVGAGGGYGGWYCFAVNED